MDTEPPQSEYRGSDEDFNYGIDSPLHEPQLTQIAPNQSRWNPLVWSSKAKAAGVAGAGALIIAIIVTILLWPSTITVHGIISSSSVNLPLGGSSGTCSLPSSGNQLLLKADGVVVATAKLGKNHIKFDSSNVSGVTVSGCYSWESFVFTGVPGGHTMYEITIMPSSGCSGTLYFKQAQLAKSVGLSCS